MAENEPTEVALATIRAEQARVVLLDQVLSQSPPDQVMEHATELGIDLGGRRSVLVVGTVSTAVLERLRDAAHDQHVLITQLTETPGDSLDASLRTVRVTVRSKLKVPERAAAKGSQKKKERIQN